MDSSMWQRLHSHCRLTGHKGQDRAKKGQQQKMNPVDGDTGDYKEDVEGRGGAELMRYLSGQWLVVSG